MEFARWLAERNYSDATARETTRECERVVRMLAEGRAVPHSYKTSARRLIAWADETGQRSPALDLLREHFTKAGPRVLHRDTSELDAEEWGRIVPFLREGESPVAKVTRLLCLLPQPSRKLRQRLETPARDLAALATPAVRAALEGFPQKRTLGELVGGYFEFRRSLQREGRRCGIEKLTMERIGKIPFHKRLEVLT
jgi:hypothetical protein